MMKTPARTLATIGVATTLALTLAACAADPEEGLSLGQIQHVHDLDFDADGALLVGTHAGVYRADVTTGAVSLVGDTRFDVMGLAVQGTTIFASGHPAPHNQDPTFVAPNVGLVRYAETGWEQVALGGVTDFHLLAATPAAPDLLLGLLSDREALATSDDAGRTWTDVGPLSARDISIDTVEADVVTATTAGGLMVSRDRGRTFAAVPDAPLLLVISADPTVEEGVVGVAVDGGIWSGSTKKGASWRTAGQSEGAVSAISARADGVVALADEGGVRVTTDAGNTWRTIVRADGAP